MTQMFRVQDVGFWKNGKILSRYEVLDKLPDKDSVALKIFNYKNGCIGETLHL